MDSLGKDEKSSFAGKTTVSRGRHELRPGIWADYRRAVWFEESRILALGDLHLGYAWAQRHRGQLLPVESQNDLKRIRALCTDYQPREVVLLGDVIHRALPIKALDEEFKALLGLFSEGAVKVIFL